MGTMIGGGKSPAPPTPSLPKAHRRSVLIVDDEQDIVEALQVGIEDGLPTVEVLSANSGRQALGLLQSRPVDLIVTDYKMPGMDGLEFLHHANQLRPGTPAIMISAYPDPRLVQRATRDYGVRLFISKPFDLDYFLDILRARLFEHRAV